MRIHLGASLVLLAFCVLAAGGAKAAIWDGSVGDNNWSTAANWDTNNVPDAAGETAIFNSAIPTATVSNVPSSATIDMIQVDVAGNVSVSLNLTGTLTLAGSGFDSILVGAGDTLNFVTGGTPRTLNIEDNTTIAAGGALNFDANVTVVVQGTNFPDVNIGNGSTFSSLGIFRVNTANTTVIDADNTGGGTVITFNQIQVDTTLAWDITGTGNVDVTINGDVHAGANGAHFDMYTNLSSGSLNYDINMAGNFSASGFTLFEVQADFGFWTFTPTTHTFTTGGGAGSFETSTFGQLNIPTGATLTVTDGAFDATSDKRVDIYQLFVDGAFAAGTNELDFLGTVFFDADSTVIDVDVAASFTQTGDVFFNCVDNFKTSIRGTVTFDGAVQMAGGASVVVVVAAFDSAVTFNDDLWINNSPFGADEDGATTTALPATINYNGNVRVDQAGGLLLGEGIHNFMGNLDLGATAAVADVVKVPSINDDFLFEVHLLAITGAPSQTLDFEPVTGSYFAVTSVTPQSLIEQNGRMALGFMDLTGANLGGMVWDGAGGDIELGGRVEGNFEIVTGNMDVVFGDIDLLEVATPSGASAGGFYTFRSTNGGTFAADNLSIGGDLNDDVGGAESNGGTVWFLDTFLVVAGDITVADGDNGGDGGSLVVRNCTVTADTVNIGDSVAGDATEGADFELSDNSTLLLFTALNATPYTTVYIFLSAIDSADNTAYSINVDALADETTVLNSFVSCDAAADVSITFGGSLVVLVGTTFEFYSPTGVKIATGSTVAALNACIFRNGVSGGSHITLTGLGNATKINCDENLFDATTGSATDALIDATGFNRLNFRCLTGFDFGLGAVILDAPTAELLDNDSITADNVTWETVANQLTLNEAATQPPGVITDSASHQTVFRFTLSAIGASVTVQAMSFSFELGGDLVNADIANASLYRDIDDDGAFDVGENFTGTVGVAATGGGVVFSVPSVVVAVGPPVTWALGITFAGGAAGKTGSFRTFVNPTTGITIASPATTIVSGLPLIAPEVPVTGPVAQVVLLFQPSDEQQNVPFSPTVVAELHDASGNVVLGRSFNVTASILSGGTAGAVLSGPLVSPSNVGTGTATFAGLRIDLIGTAYVLRFASTSPVAFVDSDPFDITAAVVVPDPPKKKNGGGGGCAAQESPYSPFAVLTALLAIIGATTVARLIRE